MSHPQHDIFENRHFQLERMILFSDAVFAIAITLLIIEIKVPHFEGDYTPEMLNHALLEKIPEFIAFAMSFIVIGQFWTNHHRIFGHIKDYTNGLLWLNLLLLMWIVVMPFSTFLNMQYGNSNTIWMWYSCNMGLIALSQLFIWRYLRRHPALCTMSHDKDFMRHGFKRSLMVTIIFFLGGALTLINVQWIQWAARFEFLLIFPALAYLKKHYKKQTVKKSGVVPTTPPSRV